MADIWSASDGGNTWNAREGGRVPAVADPIQMSVGDVRTLIMDFGNLPEFWLGGGINLAIPPVVAITPAGSGSPLGLLLTLTNAGAVVVSQPRALPVVVTEGSPLGLLLTLTNIGPDAWIGPYFVEAVFAAVVAGTYNVAFTVWLLDGTKLTRSGKLTVE